MSDAKARHMIYDGKEYTKEPAPSFGMWDDICTGCAFIHNVGMCKGSFNKEDPETYCCTGGKNYIFKEVVEEVNND